LIIGDEECDDSNADDGDGCDSSCVIEEGFECAGEPSVCSGICGDWLLVSGEECDDGNLLEGDCCSPVCTVDADGTPCSDGNYCTDGDQCLDGNCISGAVVPPWINEFDYDSNDGGCCNDRDEFIEIAGPAGTDLTGYFVAAVEGAAANCNTGFFTAPGDHYFLSEIWPWDPNLTSPEDLILDDDTGTGVGFLVVCFNHTSTNVSAAGNCDVVVPALAIDSNLKNGHLTNGNLWQCPDGIMLLDSDYNVLDAISYEGVVADAGLWGSYFNPPNISYSAPRDTGWMSGVSVEKITSDPMRAVSADEWLVTGGCTTQFLDFLCTPNMATPGWENAGQTVVCAEYACGDGILQPGEQCDEGENNSDEPDAYCRTDCRLGRCGDDIIDPNRGEVCEDDLDCEAEETCFGCACTGGDPLGFLNFSVIPGPSGDNPPDDGESSILRVPVIIPAFPITNGSQGDFNPGPIQLGAGVPDPNTGIAPLLVTDPVIIGASLPSLAGGGKVCWRISQDPLAQGFVDCDGGSNVDVTITVDSHTDDPNTPNSDPILEVGTGGGDSGPGAAVIRVILEAAQTLDDVTPCEDAVYLPEGVTTTAFTTGTSSGVILDPIQGGGTNVVTQSGQNFDCSNWAEDSGGSITAPNANMDVDVPVLGINDLAQGIRFNDD
jgi:cysteine-rich repeat protein